MHNPLDSSLDDFPVGCLVTNGMRQICYSNAYVERQYGHAPEQLVGADFLVLLSKASQIMFESYLVPLLTRDGLFDEMRLSLATRSGETLPASVSAIRGADGLVYWSIASATRSAQLFNELRKARTLLQQKIQMLHTLADTDQLTGLPNRAALTRYLAERSAAASGEGGCTLAFVDLDGFKEVNDRYGHEIGDKLLRKVAKRMATSLRGGDLVARFGGDEFVVLLSDQPEKGRTSEPLNRLVNQLSEPYEVDSVTFRISASVGATYFPQAQTAEPDQLVRQADQAMYQAKLAGGNQVCFFDLGRDQHQREHHTKLSAVRAAFIANEFELHYQPKVNMRTGRLLGAEALLRWNHPSGGVTAPATFLPVLNGTLAGVELGRWVISAALAQLQQWLRRGWDLHVSVNVAGYHLQHPSFLEELQRSLAAVPEVPPHRLEIEVLETSTIDDVGYVSSVLAACKTMGIRLSLDDFGTGYSTLAHLRDLSVDILKIDRSFVKDMLSNDGDLAIIKGVIGLARAFECDIVAEGVETREIAERLVDLGCEWGQGYYIARPMSAQVFSDWKSNWKQEHFLNKARRSSSGEYLR